MVSRDSAAGLISWYIIMHRSIQTFSFDAWARVSTHEKSYSAEKVLFYRIFFFNPSFLFTSAIFE